MFSKLIIEVGENKSHSFSITQDKRDDRAFSKLSSVTSSIQKIMRLFFDLQYLFLK